MGNKNLFKLKNSLYYDNDGESVEYFKWSETYNLLAKKGQLAERLELTDELREEYNAYDTMFKYIWIFKANCNWLLTQEENCDDFEEIK